MRMSWRFDLASDIGGRAEQQDRAAILPVPGRADEHLVVLADGMGGQQDGALAAQAVIDTARDELPRLSRDEPRQFLTELCLTAHEAIRALGRLHDSNPASTCTALYLRPEEAYWVHVGDSRLYHFEQDRLLAHTCDHTVSELMKADGAHPVPHPGSVPGDNRLYMCLGGENGIEPEFGATAVGKAEWFMLCSDGFWNHVDPGEVADARANASAGNPAADLVATATRRAGTQGDNASLVLASPTAASASGPWQRLLQSVRLAARELR
jgi:serine/threonine protein phosphatase PrpC